jgi:hypothetical protein
VAPAARRTPSCSLRYCRIAPPYRASTRCARGPRAPGVVAVAPAQADGAGDAAVIAVTPATGAAAAATVALVHRLPRITVEPEPA